MIADPSIAEENIWGPYPIYDDIAKLEYGRRFWKDPIKRSRLLTHWLDERHPQRDRFLENRLLIEEALASSLPLAELQRNLPARGSSLRCVSRDIPAVFGSFYT